MPRLSLDDAVPFNDKLIWIYVSMYVLLPLVLVLAGSYGSYRYALYRKIQRQIEKIRADGVTFAITSTRSRAPP